MTNGTTMSEAQWFVLRDLKRPNTTYPGYRQLKDAGVECFTPMKWVIEQRGNRRVKREKPVIQDLLFAHGAEHEIKKVIDKITTLQFRYVKGGAYCAPMTVRDKEMESFIKLTLAAAEPQYLSPSELKAAMVGKRIRIIGGVLDGCQGNLLSIKGSGKKRIVVNLPEVIAASVVVEPEFIELID